MFKKLLLGFTTTSGSDIEEKISEIEKFNIREIALFLTGIDKITERDLLKTLKGFELKIPFVHARADHKPDFLKSLIKDFDTKVFNLHSKHGTFPPIYDYKDLSSRVFIENSKKFLFDPREICNYGGICVDLAHLYFDRLYFPDFYEKNLENIGKFRVGCNHISGFAKAERFGEIILKDHHYFNSLSDFDYLKKIPDKFFGKYLAIEVENNFKDQLNAKKYIEKLIF